MVSFSSHFRKVILCGLRGGQCNARSVSFSIFSPGTPPGSVPLGDPISYEFTHLQNRGNDSTHRTVVSWLVWLSGSSASL